MIARYLSAVIVTAALARLRRAANSVAIQTFSSPAPEKALPVPRHILVLILPISALLLIAIFTPNVLLTVFAGVLVGVFLRLGGNAIARWTGLGQGWSLAVFCVILALFVLAFFGVAAAGLANQFSQLVERLPDVRDQVRDMASEHDWITSRLEDVDFAGMAPSGSTAATGVMATFGTLGNSVLILFIGIYTAVSPSEYRDGAAALFRPSQQDRFYDMLKSSGEALSGWLFAQLVSMSVIGILTWLGLWALGVPLAPVLGVLAGLLAFVPNIGPVLAALPAMAMGLSEGGTTVLWIVALYTAVQALESYLITPQLQRKAVSLPPALTIAFQLLLGYLFGLLGLALATPILAMVLALIREHYVPDVVKSD